jgi:hypothetical protein
MRTPSSARNATGLFTSTSLLSRYVVVLGLVGDLVKDEEYKGYFAVTLISHLHLNSFEAVRHVSF